MFLGKKKQISAPNFAPLFIQIVQTVCRYYSIKSTENSLDTVLQFDESQRITSISNLVVNGLPTVPDPELITALNGLTAPLAVQPPKYQVDSLHGSVEAGRIHTEATYRA